MRWVGNAMYHFLRADGFDADDDDRIGLVQEVVVPSRQVEGRSNSAPKCSP